MKYKFMLDSKASFFKREDMMEKFYLAIGITESNQMEQMVIKHEFANNNHNS